MGAWTLAAINRQKPEHLLCQLVFRRNRFIARLVNSRRDQLANLEGWTNALSDFILYQYLPD